MKKRFLPFGILLAATGVALTFFNTPEAVYTPVESRVETELARIDGAIKYIEKRMVNPETGDLDLRDVHRVKDEINLHVQTRAASATSLEWEEMGPNNVGGRTRAILIDQDNHDLMYAGSVSGGLWVSHSGGRAWYRAKGQDGNPLPNLIIGSIAQAPNGDVYFGTGELTHELGNGGSGFIGNGLWKKNADSDHFIQIQSVTSEFNSVIDNTWSLVAALAIQEDGDVFAATNSGLMYSSDGGMNFQYCSTASIPPMVSAQCTDVQVGTDGSIAASVGNSFYISTSGEHNDFVKKTVIDPDYPQSVPNTRIEISIAPSNPEYIYCAISTEGGRYGLMKGVYRSTDRGDSWEIIGKPGLSELNIFNQQAKYDMVIKVHPEDEDKIYVGGLDLWSWSYNESWEKLTQWGYAGFPMFTNYLHADQHELIFHPDNPDIMYSGNDGGVFKSEDGGNTFVHMNRGYNVTQFYAIGYSKYGEAVGGTQDNGTQLVAWKAEHSNSDIVQGATPQAGFEIGGGDGGYALFSRLNPDIIFSETQNAGELRRSATKGLSQNTIWAEFLENRIEVNGSNWVTPYVLHENLNDPINSNLDGLPFEEIITYVNNPLDTLFTGDIIEITSSKSGSATFNYTLTNDLLPNDTIRIVDPFSSIFAIGIGEDPWSGPSLSEIWISRNSLELAATTEWYRISDTSDVIGTPSCMEFSSDGNYLFVGTEGGALYRYSNLNYARNASTADIGGYSFLVEADLIGNWGGVITGLSVDKKDANRLAVSLGGYGTSGTKVQISTNALAPSVEFSGIQGDLPVMPAYDVLFNVTDSSHLFVATENGVWSTSLDYQALANPNIYQNEIHILEEVLDGTGEFSHYDTTIVINEVQHTQSFLDENGNFMNNIPGITWSQENIGLGNVPSFMLHQQWYPGENYGQIYVGTHGRGIFKSGTFNNRDEFYLEDPISEEETIEEYLSVYPNPVTNQLTVSFVSETDEKGDVSIYDLTGKLLIHTQVDLVMGSNQIPMDVSTLPKGTYLVHFNNGVDSQYAKIVKAY